MVNAVKCPVCNGVGEVSTEAAKCVGLSMAFGRDITEENLKIWRQRVICHGCNGRGWVEVSDNINPWLPLPVKIQPHIKTDPLRIEFTSDSPPILNNGWQLSFVEII